MGQCKITVLTPKNKAASNVKLLRKTLIGFSRIQNIVTEKVIAHNKFFWVLAYKDEKDFQKISKKVFKGEIMIKKFYARLFKVIDRANKLSDKFSKGIEWIRRKVLKTLKKKYQYDEHNDLYNNIKTMSKEDLKEFIKIEDRKEMDKLLKKDLIKIEKMLDY